MADSAPLQTNSGSFPKSRWDGVGEMGYFALVGGEPGGRGGRGRKGPRSTPSAGVGQSPRCTEQPSGQPLGSQCSCWGRDAHAEVCTRIDKQEGQSGRSEALGPSLDGSSFGTDLPGLTYVTAPACLSSGCGCDFSVGALGRGTTGLPASPTIQTACFVPNTKTGRRFGEA